jgi:hypothetical protein
MSTLRAEKALPEEAAKTKCDSGRQSSFDLCNVLDTKDDIAVKLSGSTLSQVGRDLLLNISRTFWTSSLLRW